MHLGTNNHDINRFDFLRIIAALMVLYSHCYPLYQSGLADPLAPTPFISFGTVGVWIFFVISGYLVFTSFENSSNLADFIIKRILRIYPALIAACLFCVFIVGAAFTPFDFQTYITHPQTLLYAWTASGFDIHYNLPLVFADNPRAHTVNGSLWTIKYELTCYVALAVLCFFKRTRRILVVAAPAFLIGVGYLRMQSQPVNTFQSFLGFDHYHITLGLLFFLGASFAAFKKVVTPSLPLIGVQLALWFLTPPSISEILFYSLIATTVLYVGFTFMFLPKIPNKIGDLSYATYLFSFPIQQSLIALGIGSLGFSTFVFASITLTLFVAFLSWHLIEKPALQLKNRLAIAIQIKPLDSATS